MASSSPRVARLPGESKRIQFPEMKSGSEMFQLAFAFLLPGDSFHPSSAPLGKLQGARLAWHMFVRFPKGDRVSKASQARR